MNDEIRRLGETLNDMLDRLESSLERERRFVSDASHELRTPIAVAKTELQGAGAQRAFGPDVGEAIEAAIEECDSLGQLAKDLLVVAPTDDGGLELLLDPCQFTPRSTPSVTGSSIVPHPTVGTSSWMSRGPMWCSAIKHGSGRPSGTSSTMPFAAATELSPCAAPGSRT